MKTIIVILIKICCVTAFTSGLSSCRTKHLINQKSHTSADQTKDINIKTAQYDVYQRGSLISLRDSTKHQYQVNIFPLDSFSFSMQEGFKGRAHSIELIREILQRKETFELHDSIAKKQHTSDYREEAAVSIRAKENKKDVMKQSFNINAVLVCVGLLALAGYWYKRFYSS